MQNGEGLNRRKFLGRLGAGALLSAAGLGARRTVSAATADWTPAPVLENPNILIIMVDQMRQPVWLSNSQMKALSATVLPNIVGRIQNNSYSFDQFYCAATNCTPARATLLTGLYAPQTAIYCTDDSGASPALNPAYWTWGAAVPHLNTAYKSNMWWFGKWHLSNARNATPLIQYGFNTRTYPGGPPPYNPSPNGVANEGTVGGLFDNIEWANDSQIAGDFVGWIEGQPPTTTPTTPWCATVSFINPHDITFAPAWLAGGIPTGVVLPKVYFPPPSGSNDPPQFYTADPSPWNYENLNTVTDKPTLQYELQKYEYSHAGPVDDWVLFLNQYYWLQNYVDQQVGKVLDALAKSQYAKNTWVVFLSDHGEYAGSHGLHTKGWGAYDEGMNVPLSIQYPGQTGATAMGQMCSCVDFLGLVCDLATQGSGQWQTTFPFLASRQSLWSFLSTNSAETRVAPLPVALPYVFHTFDELAAQEATPLAHVVCLRTKTEDGGRAGAKLNYYWQWDKCTTFPNTMTPQGEFYDYSDNTQETGNDFTNPSAQKTIGYYNEVLGTWGPPGTGLIGTELNAPLLGTGVTNAPLTEALSTAQQTYFNFAYGRGKCTVE